MILKLPVKAKSGFTLAEVLTGLCISALMMATLSAVLMSGLKASERTRTNFSKYQALRLFFLTFEKDLRNALAYEPFPFKGKGDEIQFPSRTLSLQKITYRLEAGRIIRFESGLKESLKEAAPAAKAFLPGLKALNFEFPYRREDGETLFLPFWMEDPYPGIPKAVKVTIELSSGVRFSRVVSVPQGRLGLLPEGKGAG